MNEEIMNEAEIVLPKEETVNGADIAAETAQTDRIGELEALRTENAALKRKIFCAERGVPAEMAEDIFILGEHYAARENISFEEAAGKAFERLMKISEPKAPVTTGVRTSSSRKNENELLRNAFGLKH